MNRYIEDSYNLEVILENLIDSLMNYTSDEKLLEKIDKLELDALNLIDEILESFYSKSS